MTRIEIFNVLRKIVQTVTGVDQVILANQVDSSGAGLASPSGEYITIEPKQSISERGQAIMYRNTSASPRAIDVDPRAQVIVEASINIFRGVDAISQASRLLQCNKRSDISTLLFRNKLGWNRTSAPNNLTGMQSGNPEQRAQIYIYLMYETQNTVTINHIETVSYEVQYEDGSVIASGSV